MSLVKGTWDVKSISGKVERVRPQDIKGTGLLTIEGELDDISGSGQTKAAKGLCTGVKDSEYRHLEVPGAGHYGIFSGRRWREVVYPFVRDFILDHQPSVTQAPKALVRKPAVAKKVASPTATRSSAKKASTPVKRSRQKSTTA
jgi:poly(3-hydroxybutyrate) depolymerase